MKCRHDYCRCARAAELAVMAERTGDARLAYEATQVHQSEVECRVARHPVEEVNAMWVDGMPQNLPANPGVVAAIGPADEVREAFFSRSCAECD